PAHTFPQFLEVFCAVFLGKSIVQNRQALLLYFHDLDFVSASFTGEFRSYEVGWEINVNGPLVARLGSHKLFGKPGDKSVGSYLDPKVLLLTQTFCGWGNLGNGLTIASSRVIHYYDVAIGSRARNRLNSGVRLTQNFERPRHIFVRDSPSLAFDRNAFVFGKLKLRSGLDGGSKLQRLAAAKLDFLDIRIPQYLQVLLIHRFFVSLRDEFALGFLLNILAILTQYHVPWGFPGAETRQFGLFLKVLGDRVEGLIDLLNLDFDPHQFFTRG